MVHVNGKLLQRYIKKSPLSQEGFAQHLKISPGLLRIMLDDGRVSHANAMKVADGLAIDFKQLILPAPCVLLPSEPDYYLSLKHGWFVDDDREKATGAKWHQEKVAFTTHSTDNLFGVLALDGHISPPFNDTDGFNVRITLLSEMLCVLLAKEVDGQNAFSASFTTIHNGVLCGMWSGVNEFLSKQASYMIFLSPRPVDHEELQELTRVASIDPVKDAKQHLKTIVREVVSD